MTTDNWLISAICRQPLFSREQELFLILQYNSTLLCRKLTVFNQMAGIYYFNQNPVLRTAVDIMTVLDKPRGIKK